MNEPASDPRSLGLLAEEVGAFSTTFVHRQIEALAEFQPFVACWKLSRGVDVGAEPVYSMRTQRPIHRLLEVVERVLPHRHYFADRVQASQVLREVLARHRPQLLHIHFGWTAARVVKVLKEEGVRYTMVLHGSDVNGAYEHPGTPYTRRLREAFCNAEVCFFASEDLLQKGLELGCPPERAEVFYLGVPVPSQQAQPASGGRTRIVSVGRLIELKGHIYLVRGFAQMLAKGADADLVVIGPGPEKARLVAEAERLGVSDRVAFTGGVQVEDVYEELRRAHIYVHPSVRVGAFEEGLGLALQEAMAAGLAVIGADTGGVSETFVDEESGLLVPERDADALATVMGRLVGDPSLRGRLGAAARARIETDFNLETQNERLRQRLGGLLAKAR